MIMMGGYGRTQPVLGHKVIVFVNNLCDKLPAWLEPLAGQLVYTLEDLPAV